ncbi:amidohydrolase family protein [Paenibacillus validus]
MNNNEEGAVKQMGVAPRLIDTDFHNDLSSPQDLLPFLPKAFHQQWLESGIGVGGKPWSSVGYIRKDAISDIGSKPGSDPVFALKHHMDKYGIDYAILTGNASMIGISLNYDPDYANAVASAHNDWQNEVWLKADPRYKGSILVSHTDPAAAVKEIERLAGHPDIVQVMMCSVSRTLLGQRFFHPIYEAAERHGLPVAIHPGNEGIGPSYPPTPSGYPTRYMEWQNIIPINYMSQVNSLVCEGVFEKFPKLKFVAIEGGISWLPHLMWRMDKNYKALRDTVPWLKELPSEYIRKHVVLTTQPIEEPADPEHLVQIIKMSGAEDMIMYSSDYPHWDYDNPKMVLSLFPRELREKIGAKNAIQLYGLDQTVDAAGTEGEAG